MLSHAINLALKNSEVIHSLVKIISLNEEYLISVKEYTQQSLPNIIIIYASLL